MKNRKYNILVTRPKHQAEELCGLVEQQGWNSIRFPTLEIVAIKNKTIKQQLETIDQYNWLIFISANAVNFAVMANDGKIDNLLGISIAVIGNATGKALKSTGLSATLAPETQFNSEGLLETKQMKQVKDKSCLIVRGKGGQETLANSLRERGATVEYMEVYSRNMPESNSLKIAEMLQHQLLDAITITSGDALKNLLRMLSKKYHEKLFSLPLIVISKRIKKMAETNGFKHIIVTEKPADRAIIKAIKMSLSN